MFSGQIGSVPYIQQGESPKLLIISGTHGDEHEVIGSIYKNIERYNQDLGSYLFIPEISPSAVAQKTRHNQAGQDLNRLFTSQSNEPEIIANRQILANHNFDLCLNFHEDYERTEFYFYDSHEMKKPNRLVLQQMVEAAGVELYNGIDDPSDPVLGNKIVDGYYSAEVKVSPNSGMFTDYALDNGLIQRGYVFEIPGMLPVEKKDTLVQHLFEAYLLGLLA